MKISKIELARKISQLKGIVPKKTTINALQGILVQDGYLIASNTELTVKATLEGIDGDNFIIPAKAFDLITNLPAGDVSVTCDGDVVTIQMGSIKNKFKTLPVEQFAYARSDIDTNKEDVIPADELKKAISHVTYAISENMGNRTMEGVFFECKDGKLNLVGLDGHRIAWDSLDMNGSFEMIVPKPAVEKIMQLDMQGNVSISHDKYGAVFRTEDYEIYTRLIEGNYVNYRTLFTEGEIQTAVEKKALLDAINRAKLCGAQEDKAPVLLNVSGQNINITYKNQTADYTEDISTQIDVGDGLKIAFDPTLVMECVKAFECENISISFTSRKHPAIIHAEDSDMTALVLPVNFKE